MRQLALKINPKVGFGLAVLTILVSVGFVVASLYALIRNDAHVHQTLTVLDQLDHLLILQTEAETAERDFIVSGDEHFLAPFTRAQSPEEGVTRQLQVLRQLTGENSEQQVRLDLLESNFAANLVSLQQGIDLRKNSGLAAAAATIGPAEQSTSDAIQQSLAELHTQETDALQIQSAESDASLQQTILALALGVGTSLVLLGWAFHVSTVEIGERRRAELAVSELNAGLEQRVQERTAELTASTARYVNTLDNMLEGCQLVDPDWHYLYVNDALVRQGKSTKEQLLGHTMMEVYPGIQDTALFEALRTCRDERTPIRFENEFTFPDGSTGCFELSLEPVPEGVFIVSIDITERKHAEEEIRRRANQLAAAYDAGLALNSMLEPRPQLIFLFKIAMRALNADRAEFFRPDSLQQELRFELGVGHPPKILRGLEELSVSTTEEGDIAGWVSTYRVPLVVPELTAEPRWHGSSDRTVRSGIWVPVQHEDELLGVLGLLSERPNAFTPTDERMLMLFSNQAAVALRNARRFEETKNQVAELNALRTTA